MKNYTITVNGTAYDVTVEENRKRSTGSSSKSSSTGTEGSTGSNGSTGTESSSCWCRFRKGSSAGARKSIKDRSNL